VSGGESFNPYLQVRRAQQILFREFPLTRVLGISHTLSSQVDGPAVLRVTHDALLLTAACVWLVNGLHARPDDNPAARKLLEAALPLTYRSDVGPDMLAFPARTLEENVEEEEEDDLEYTRAVPYNPFGIVFLRRVKVNLTVPRMRVGGRFLTTPAFKFLFGGTEEEIRYKYHSVGLIPSELTVRARVVTNKNKTTPIYFNFAAEPEPTLFNLAAKGHTLPPPPEDGGSDIETEPDTDPNANDIDSAVTQMWRQFLVDIAYKTPVPRGSTSPSYLRLSAPARQSVGEGFYKNSTLSEIWRSCQYKIASRDDWNLAFEHLFPPREHQTSARVQNYRQCKYYLKWKEICSIADETSVAGIRRQLRKKIDGFFWIPHACQDKLWPTAQNKKFVRLPPDSTGPAPRLLVKKMPTWMHGDH
jgi:hypothetical protein